MVSKELKFIFIHNFKTGGTSISQKLGLFNELENDVQDHRSLSEIQRLTQRNYFLKLGLYSLKRGKPGRFVHYMGQSIAPELTATEFNSFYKFTFVRNTWAQVFSWYRNIMRDSRMRAKYGITDSELSFERFLEHHMNHQKFSQYNHIIDLSGKVNMDFIGRFENLQADFDIVGQRLGIEDTELPKLLVKNHDSYVQHYSESAKDFVYKHYREEIDYFGFEFGA
ncbi:sulfotransferase family 2 domain-containing protein [Gilvibacter sp.]|uniref:sulfotransferase family 2 domain-containing protein n=1 Tax=Gilvibacter sp. TaxID=2729997 RepID=UPI0025C64587|nr:sulfotransferase family 2 domain-containing protein [Gilvibacter sp.]NQX77063.1 sulfotransferase family 2 domain-containing protein [Gilvibacter sp.]